MLAVRTAQSHLRLPRHNLRRGMQPRWFEALTASVHFKTQTLEQAQILAKFGHLFVKPLSQVVKFYGYWLYPVIAPVQCEVLK